MICPSSFDYTKCVEIMIEMAREKRWRLGPRLNTIVQPPRTIAARVKAPKLRTFIRGNARMT